MERSILDTLGGRFLYTPPIRELFLKVLSASRGIDSKVYQQFLEFFKPQACYNDFSKFDDENFLTELKCLNKLALDDRIQFIEANRTPETVVTKYLKKLNEELSKSAPDKQNLNQEEDEMQKHLLATPYNEDRTAIQGINSFNLRMVLQSWHLFPEIINDEYNARLLVSCLWLSECFV